MKTKCVSGFVALCVLLVLAVPAGAAAPLTGEKAIQQLKDTGQYESLAAAMTGARYGIQPGVQPVQSLEGLTTKDTKGTKKGVELASSTLNSQLSTPDSQPRSVPARRRCLRPRRRRAGIPRAPGGGDVH